MHKNLNKVITKCLIFIDSTILARSKRNNIYETIIFHFFFEKRTYFKSNSICYIIYTQNTIFMLKMNLGPFKPLEQTQNLNRHKTI